jgi:hypothetical protein
MSDSIKEVVVNGQTIKIVTSECNDSPRSWDCLSTLIFVGKYQHLGDEHELNHNDYNGWDEFERAVRKEYNVATLTKVYGYSHGGLAISTSPFQCNWDSGVLGFAIVTKEKLREEHSIKNVTKKYRVKAELVVEGEVETLNQYINGDVYGFEIEDAEGDVIDSCYGFYGDDVMTNGMDGHLDAEIVTALAQA